MTHIDGHPTLDRMMHTISGVFKPKESQTQPAQAPQTPSAPAALATQDRLSFHTHPTGIPKQRQWVPFQSVQTGAAVGAMTGVIVGTIAGFASAAAIGVFAKDAKMALAVGSSVFLTSMGAGAISGAVGYKTRSMNIDTTEPPIGSMFDTPEQARLNIERSRQTWERALSPQAGKP